VELFEQNLGGLAAHRNPSAFAQCISCDMKGFVAIMLAEDTVNSTEPLLAGYTEWHCVRPRPDRGRGHGGIPVFVKQGCALISCPGVCLTHGPAAGIMWVRVPAYVLTIAVCSALLALLFTTQGWCKWTHDLFGLRNSLGGRKPGAQASGAGRSEHTHRAHRAHVL
jgi:hypothetical protein